MEEGVEILLAKRVRIPFWISNQSLNVKVLRKRINGRLVRSLQIKGGGARFGFGGVVEIKMPDSKAFWPAFPGLKVREIRGLKGNLLERNYFLCEDCFTNTGRIVKSSPSKERAGRSHVIMECSECGKTWEITNF